MLWVMFTHRGPAPGPPSAPRINAHSAIQGSFVLDWLGPGCCWAAGVLSMAPGQAGYPNASSCPTGLSLDRLWLGWKRPQQGIGQFWEGLEKPGKTVSRPGYRPLPPKASITVAPSNKKPCSHIAALLVGERKGFRHCRTLKPR